MYIPHKQASIGIIMLRYISLQQKYEFGLRRAPDLWKVSNTVNVIFVCVCVYYVAINIIVNVSLVDSAFLLTFLSDAKRKLFLWDCAISSFLYA